MCKSSNLCKRSEEFSPQWGFSTGKWVFLVDSGENLLGVIHTRAGLWPPPTLYCSKQRVAVAKISSRHPLIVVLLVRITFLSGVANRRGVFAWGVGPRFRPRIPFQTLMLYVLGLGLACPDASQRGGLPQLLTDKISLTCGPSQPLLPLFCIFFCAGQELFVGEFFLWAQFLALHDPT